MPRRPRRHKDPLVRDLQTLRQLSWSRPERFTRLEVLLEHPLVLELADGADDPEVRVAALRAVLQQGVDVLREKGADGPLVAGAAAALLRLDPRFEKETISEIRELVARSWPRQSKRGQDAYVSAEGFRKYVENPRVIEPLARVLEALGPAAPDADADAVELEDIDRRIAQLLTAPASLGRVAVRVWATERAAHCERLTSIAGEGYFRIRDAPEMFELLGLMIAAARHEMQAVDHIDLTEWGADPRLGKYLKSQLERVQRARIPLTRIRLVDDEELEDAEIRRLLQQFDARHRRANVTLLLCHSDAVDYLETAFTQPTGLFLIDPQADPTAVIGWGGGGPKERTELHMRETERLRAARREFELLRRHALEQCDGELRHRAGLSPAGR